LDDENHDFHLRLRVTFLEEMVVSQDPHRTEDETEHHWKLEEDTLANVGKSFIMMFRQHQHAWMTRTMTSISGSE
jgi:hypothetical protein